MSPADAMTQYLELVTAFDPNWKSKSGGAPSSGSTGGRGGTGGGHVVSTLMDEDEALDDESKTIFDWCKENDIPKLVSMITTTNLNSRDEQVNALRNLEQQPSLGGRGEGGRNFGSSREVDPSQRIK